MIALVFTKLIVNKNKFIYSKSWSLLAFQHLTTYRLMRYFTNILGDIMSLKKMAEDIASAKNVVALTGAGISVESGIPPFRGKGGIWEKIDPMKYAHINTFMQDPEKVWNVLLKDMKKFLDIAKPNAAHIALAKLEEMGLLKTIITQNIDCLHQMAGNSDVIEFHGNFAWQSCLHCKKRYATSEINLTKLPPRCECGGILRPECIFFGETIPHDTMLRSNKAVEKCDVMLVIGTSAVVDPASYMPIIAKNSGAKIIEINPETTPLTETISDYIIKGKAGNIMSKLIKAIL